MKIAVICSIRKPLHVVKAWMDCVRAQYIEPGDQIKFFLCTDNADWDVVDYLTKRIGDDLDLTVHSRPLKLDYGWDGESETRFWTLGAMWRVAGNTNPLMDKARAWGADAMWILGADILCEKSTLSVLRSSPTMAVSGVFWTKWSPTAKTLPQVWNGWPDKMGDTDEECNEFIGTLLARRVTQCQGGGACMLLRGAAMGQRYMFDQRLPREGFWTGEDRHFSAALMNEGVVQYADGWPDIYHLYTPEQEAGAAGIAHHLLAAERPELAEPGDLLCLTAKRDGFVVGSKRIIYTEGMEVPRRVGQEWMRKDEENTTYVLIDFKKAQYPPIIREEM